MIFSFNPQTVLHLDPGTSSAQFNHAITFCKDWLGGKKHFVFYTSGSTGTPKKIELGRKQLEASANATIGALQLTSGEKIFVCLNTQLIAGAMMLVRGMILNCEIFVVEPSSDPLRLPGTDHGMTFASFVPMQLQSLLTDDDAVKKANCFKNVLVGGAEINTLLEKKLSQLTCSVYHTYGMTETVSHIALKGIGKENSFSALPGVELKTDGRGCLCIRASMTNHEWIKTNDIAELLDKNHFNILGRIDEVINSGGVKIFPAKIEAALYQMISILGLDVKELFVSSEKDEILGERAFAVLCSQTLSGEEENLMKEGLRRLLSPYEIPKKFYYQQMFEKTGSGKIDKFKTLKNLYNQPF